MALSLNTLTRMPFSRPARTAQCDRDQDAREQQSVVSLRIVSRYDDGERDAARQRKVEASLLNHQQLAQADNCDDRCERQASRQGAPGYARGGEQKAHKDQGEGGDDDRHEASCMWHGKHVPKLRQDHFVLTVWFIPAPSQGRTLAERSMSKASVNDRTEF